MSLNYNTPVSKNNEQQKTATDLHGAPNHASQYSLHISMVYWTFYMVNSTFFMVNSTFYMVNSTFYMVN